VEAPGRWQRPGGEHGHGCEGAERVQSCGDRGKDALLGRVGDDRPRQGADDQVSGLDVGGVEQGGQAGGVAGDDVELRSRRGEVGTIDRLISTAVSLLPGAIRACRTSVSAPAPTHQQRRHPAYPESRATIRGAERRLPSPYPTSRAAGACMGGQAGGSMKMSYSRSPPPPYGDRSNTLASRSTSTSMRLLPVSSRAGQVRMAIAASATI
jgi:hypothetical protein